MTWWNVTLTTEQPLTIGTGATRAFYTPTLGYIPGSTLRGALAAAWLTRHGTSHPGFRETFDGDVRFGPLLAEHSDVSNQSVVRFKYSDDPSIDRALEPYKLRSDAEELKGDIVWGEPAPHKVVTTTEIDPVRKTAKEGSLFSRQAHTKHRTFTGHIVGDEALVDALTAFESIGVGGRQSVMGRARIRIERSEAPSVAQDGPVVLRTLSPTILLDGAGRPTCDLTTAFPGLTVTSCWAARLTDEGTSGWHMASGTPKPRDIAIAPGAVVVLDRPGPDRVRTLLDRGIGTRRVEGFGWLDVVTEPWRHPARTSEAKPEPSPSSTQDFASWSRPKRRALAAWLRDHRRGSDITAIEQTRAWGNLTRDQKKRARELLAETPDERRAAIASELERG